MTQRRRQLIAGISLIIGITIVLCTALSSWGYLPDVLAEWLGLMIGVATSPFFMELSCLIVGFILIISINQWRNQRDGDEFVTLAEPPPHPTTRIDMNPSQSPAESSGKTLHVDAFLRLACGDVSSLGKLAREYLDELHDALPDWQRLAQANEFQQLREQLHRSRGSAAQFGFERLTRLLEQTELPDHLETNGFDLSRFEQEVHAIEEALSQLLGAFEV